MRSRWFSGRRTWLLLWTAVIAAVLSTSSPTAAGISPSAADVDPALRGLTGDVGVIVQERRGAEGPATELVEAAGGTVDTELPLVHGFAATVPATAIDDLAELASVRALTLDRAVTVQSGTTTTSIRSAYTKSMGAEVAWAQGTRGSGVTVALVDTGITAVPDLAGRVLRVRDDLLGTYSPCVNLSGEDHCDDSYGHGTFLAGIIAGNGASSGGKWKGVAPEANLVSIKIAGRDGAADVSNVLAAIQWVVSFREAYGIKVLNLSLGTDGTQSYRTDPLNYAVQRAWDSGITVVVSASNRGPAAGTIAKPGDDPLVITVGAVDDRGTTSINDDRLPDFSGRGPTAADGLAKPDVVAPGAHMVSLRAPGSAVDTEFPTFVDGAYRRGSGTSMSAAAVSGAVALLTQANSSWTPDRIKFALMSGARDVAGGSVYEVGVGTVDVNSSFNAPLGVSNVGVDRSNGLGVIDLSRGTVTVHTDDPMQTVVSGSLTTQLLLYEPLDYIGIEWTGAKWYGAKWYGAKWYGAKWYGGADEAESYGSEWQGAKWYGAWE